MELLAAVTAIREAGCDGNPATDADPNWTPLFGTPAIPDHPAGHGCVSGSMVNTMPNFFRHRHRLNPKTKPRRAEALGPFVEAPNGSQPSRCSVIVSLSFSSS